MVALSGLAPPGRSVSGRCGGRSPVLCTGHIAPHTSCSRSPPHARSWRESIRNSVLGQGFWGKTDQPPVAQDRPPQADFEAPFELAQCHSRFPARRPGYALGRRLQPQRRIPRGGKACAPRIVPQPVGPLPRHPDPRSRLGNRPRLRKVADKRDLVCGQPCVVARGHGDGKEPQDTAAGFHGFGHLQG